MSDIKSNYGLLIGKDIKLHRTWFKQMTALHGINCKYRAPLKNKEYDILNLIHSHRVSIML